MEPEINIKLEVEKLLEYGINKNFILNDDVCLVRNNIKEYLRIEGDYEGSIPPIKTYVLDDNLNNILQYCYETGVITDTSAVGRSVCASKIMGFITPPPSELNKKFRISFNRSPIDATDFLYNFYIDIGYVSAMRIKKSEKWDHEEEYGGLECEVVFTNIDSECYETVYGGKDKEFYPKCALCKERVGYIGGVLSGQNLRLIKHELAGDTWYFGYSFLAHFNEQCVISSERHEPRVITDKTFRVMLEFVERYPHYFLGVDADLPMLGQASHDHFLGGSDVLPVEYAESSASFTHDKFPNVEFFILKWPVSAIRLEGFDIDDLVNAATFIFNEWKIYSDEHSSIAAFSEENGKTCSHNSVSAVTRKNNRGHYEIDIFLRNNKTSPHSPNGIFNTADEDKNIKWDDVRILDIMGRIVMTSERENELLHVMEYVMTGKEFVKGSKKNLDKHSDWIKYLQNKYGVVKDYYDAKRLIYFEVGKKYAKILHRCGVFKLNGGEERFKSFMIHMGFAEAKSE